MAECRVHGERAVYSSDWVNVHLIDVEQRDGHRVEHNAVRMQPVAAAGVLDDQERALLMWRQYGYVSTKHLCRSELHIAEPKGARGSRRSQ